MEIQTHLTAPVVDAGPDAETDASAPPDAAPSDPDASFPMNGPPPGIVAFPNTSKGCAVAGAAGRAGLPTSKLACLGLLGALLLRRRRTRRS
jgi:hypothetical protein